MDSQVLGSNKERDTRTKTVTLLEKFIEENNDEGGDDELNDQQKADTGTKVAWLAVKTTEDVNGSLTEGDDQSED